VVWPRLRERGLPATLFVPTGFVAGNCPAPLGGAERLPPVSWAQLAEMTASGLLTLGAHSESHQDLRRLPEHQLRAELRRPKECMEDRLGIPVRGFCYPRALWNRRLEREVRQIYDWAVVGGGKRIALTPVPAPYRLPRTSVRSDVPLDLARWLESSVWLEEWAADRVRRLR